MKKSYVPVCFLVSTFFLGSCSESRKSEVNPKLESGKYSIVQASSKAECESGLKSFETSLHKLLRKDCTQCHDIPANPQAKAPPHSVENSHTSYYFNITYVNWHNVENCKIMERVRTAHWKQYPGGNCKTTEDDMRETLKAWWEGGQKDCPSLGNYISKPTSLNLDLSNWKRVKVNLPSESDALKDGFFSVEIRVENGKYQIRKPFMEGITLPVKVKRIYAILNGKAFDTPLDLVKGIVEPEASGTTAVLSAYTTVFAVEKQETDVISFGFDDLKANKKFECSNLESFKAHVVPEIKRRNCFVCHGGDGKPGETVAKSRLNMDQPEGELCRAMLARGNGVYTVESPLIAYPLNGINGHPPVIPHSGEVLPSWTEWVKSEKLHNF